MQSIRAESRLTRHTTAPTLASVSRSPIVWWVALALLVLNDHLLKGAGLLPGWLTGKLSDFAGLIVAPVVAAAVLRARTGRARALAFTLVVAPFAAIKLSPAAARAAVAIVGALGIHWRVWCDPTDLIALVVLPLAWGVARDWMAAATPSRAARGRRLLAIALASAACLATSKSRPGFRTSAYLANMTLDDLEVRVYRASGGLNCAAIAAAPAAVLAAPFVPERCTRLAPGIIMPIDRVWWDLADVSYEDAATEPACDAVIARVTGLPDTLLTWLAVEDVDADSPVDESVHDHLDPHGIFIERAGARLFAAGSSLISAQPVEVALPDVACGVFPDAGTVN